MVKQRIIDLVNTLPEQVAIDELMYKLYILANRERAMNDIENDDVYSTEEVFGELGLDEA